MSSYADQEEIDKLKQWWKTYGNSLLMGLVLGVVSLLGYNYWTRSTELQRVEASALYEQLGAQLRDDGTEWTVAGEKLIREYGRTPYAGMAALLMASKSFESGDRGAAQEKLRWALDNARGDSVRLVARLRLARIALDEADIATAAAMVDVKDITGFESEFNELRGDIALNQGQLDVARAAYRLALQELPADSSYKAVLDMKLDDLGPESNS